MNKTEKSTKLTLYITYAFMALLAVMMVLAVDCSRWFFGDIMRETTLCTVIVTFYCCCPAAWAALILIVKILRNILRDMVFTSETVRLLGSLSLCCTAVTLICALAGIFYMPFIIFSLGAAFMTLILIVLKNVMAKATQLKAENELTI